MKILSVFGFLLLLYSSCSTGLSTKSFEADDSLTYSRVYLTEKSKLKLKPNDRDSTFIEISFPKFEGNFSESLNRFVENQFLKFPKGNTDSVGISQFSKDFVLDYEKFIQSQDEYYQYWYFSSNCKVISQTYPIISFSSEVEVYTGGAHPMLSVTFANYNVLLQKKVELIDILEGGQERKLIFIADSIFRKQEGLSKDQALDDYFFENKSFSIANNFAILDSGLLFMYNYYEIKPYSGGMTSLFIPNKLLSGIVEINKKSKK